MKININNISTDANNLFTELTKDVDIKLPTFDFDDPQYNIPFDPDDTKPIEGLTNADLASGCVDGDGTFDVLMRSAMAILQNEFEKNRLTGSDYAKALIGVMGEAMGNATQFIINRDKATWEGRLAQVAAITARVDLITAKLKAGSTLYETYTTQARYAEAKMNAANAGITYEQGKYRYEEFMPVEFEILTLQKKGQEFQNEGLDLQNQVTDFNFMQMLPQQLLLLIEQTESARAQTLDLRSDGAVVVGSIGTQKDLYKQQIKSYQHNAQINTAKMYTDYSITSKSLDVGLVGPNNFTNTSVDSVLNNLKQSVGLM